VDQFVGQFLDQFWAITPYAPSCETRAVHPFVDRFQDRFGTLPH
jgi:hypothetical protein